MIKIVTDSSCDLTNEETEKWQVYKIPLTISFGEVSYLDGVEITPKDFIKKMSRTDLFPKSSQPSLGKFIDLYNDLTEDGSEVISIHLAKKLSGTVETAKTAASMVKGKVTVIDSYFTSRALGFQVIEAAKLSKEGWTSKEITDRLTGMKAHTYLYVVVDTLENLAKGGRIGKGTAMIGSLLNIKPIAILEDGEYSPVAKVRSQTQAVKYMAKQFMNDIRGKTIKYASIAHADGQDFALKLKEQIEKNTGFQSVEILWTSPVISTHTGQGAIGFSYYAE
ncbi:DegV family protein [Siminovitchia sediminis]|uniref:DegV family protein n=1 Tax=Siminovitchia sediminis TaxID=1274353 RepID=A0ABW4KIT2_9BACI